MKKVLPKNYLILLGLVILVICACFAFNNLYVIYHNRSAKTSPFETCNVINYEDLKNATKDIGSDTFLIVSYLENYEVIENEKKIYNFLNKNNLTDNIVYLNVTEYMENEEFKPELNKVLKLNDDLSINKFPAVVYYKDGKPAITIDSKDHLLDKSDFEHLIDMYELAS